jgi:DNA-directed RNA polymerase subunit beta'
MEDCGSKQGIEILRHPRVASFADRVMSRMLASDIKVDGTVIAKAGDVVSPELAAEIDATSVESVWVRSPFTCTAGRGLCANCYGWDFSTRKMVEIGVPVGVIAAQSIGEPGTQLTMRVKHSGGIVGLDVTQGLPRVEEVFEVRNPKNPAMLAEISGKVSITQEGNEITISIKTTTQPTDEKSYIIPAGVPLLVEDGQLVHAGQALTAGVIDAREILQLQGLLPAQQYILDQVQAVYESQGIPIHDKHFEVVARKMGDKVQIEQPGDTDFLTGEIIERARFINANEETMAAGGEPATAKVMIMGITRSSLFTTSWLSAASFQHTKNVLTDASAAGAIDYLEGLKENVIIGRLIPTTVERAALPMVA